MPTKPAFLTSLPLTTSHRHPHLTPRRSSTMTAKLNIGNVSEQLGAAISTLATETLATKSRFTFAISGGSLPKLLAAGIPGQDISAWRAYLADERIVPLDHADSNYKEIATRLPGLEVVPAATDLPPPACARDYEGKIEEFDVVLLGLGPDGHTCSLFPDHPLLHESTRSVAWITDSPKPPPERITLTFPVLNNAKKVMFVCTGAGKAGVVKDILENPESKLPGALVKPESKVEWFLDEAAASELSAEIKS